MKCRPLALYITQGQRADIKGAVALAGSLPSIKYLLADKAYDAGHFRGFLMNRKIEPVIPSTATRKIKIPHDERRCEPPRAKARGITLIQAALVRTRWSGGATSMGQAPWFSCAYKNRNVVERMFGRLKDWRRVATRYDKLARNFFAALCLASLLCFWI